MRLKNNLWKPDSEQSTPKEKRKPPQDDICLHCPNYPDGHCNGLCPPLQWINGRSETKEIIPDNPVKYGIEQVDYNKYLHEVITDNDVRMEHRIEMLRSISDYRLRAIAACVLAHIPQSQIAKLTHSSQSRISRLYRIVR